MHTQKPTKKKACPQCGFNAEGLPVEDAASAAIVKRVPPPPKFDYDCGNCGYGWID